MYEAVCSHLPLYVAPGAIYTDQYGSIRKTMTSTIRAAAFLIALAPALVLAEGIAAPAAYKLLSGNTFVCDKNSRGELCWFYQIADGTFTAKLQAKNGSIKSFSGTWFLRDDDGICWDWTGGKKYCYTSFKVDGKRIDLVREDGVIDPGAIESGNTQGL